MNVPSYSVDHLIASRLPEWLRVQKPEALLRLHDAWVQQQRVVERLRPVLSRVQTPESFAAPLLEAAIQKELGLDLDPRRASLYIQWQTKIPIATLLPAIETHRFEQSLLAAALHNFEVSEAQEGSFDPASQLRSEAGDVLSVSPARFAALCRTLDIGAHYQKHLADRLKDVRPLLEQKQRADLAVAVEQGLLQGALTEHQAQLLRALVDDSQRLPGLRHESASLRLYGKALMGAIVIRVWHEHWHLFAYLPDDPQGAITSFEHWPALFETLGQRLRSPEYPAFIQRFVRERDRPGFSRALARAQAEGTGAVRVDGRHEPVKRTPLDLLAQQQIDKWTGDGRTLAVPTGDEDRATRAARLQSYVSLGLDLLGIAALFVPGLNALMLGVAAVQIADDLYEGFEAWELGDREQALRHLCSVAIDLAVPAAVAAGSVVLGRVLQRSVRVRQMLPVLDDSGPVRLGLPEHVEHPQSVTDAGPLLRRMDEALAEVTDDQARMLLNITGLKTAHIRRLHLEQAKPPARILDAWQRMRGLAQDPPVPVAVIDQQLLVLPTSARAVELTLQRDFPGLSARHVRQIVDHANTQQRAVLAQGRVPLTLAEQARTALREARLDRACAGRLLPGALNADAQRLLDAHVTDRQHAAQVLGLDMPAFRPPVRHGDGRLSYPLSGRGVGAWRAIDSAVRQLYPTFSFTQVQRYVEALRREGIDVWEHIRLQRQHLTQLEVALTQWQEGLSDLDLRASRSRVASRMRRCWRRQGSEAAEEDTSLIVENERIGLLPELPEGVDFSHVSELTLRGLDLSDVPDAFLARFSGVRHLDLSGNHLTAVPPGLERLPQLSRLGLAANRIRIGTQDNQVLSRLGHVETLDLSRNPLGLQLDLSTMPRLRVVGLRGCGLFALPPGLLSRMALESADLRDNLIVHLPEGVFTAPPARVARLEFHDNPLNPESRARLQAFQVRNGLGGQSASTHGVVDESLQRWWLQGLPEQERSRRAGVWQRLLDEPGSADFFRLIADLRMTADFLLRGRVFRQRVWTVIEACEAHAELRQALFEMAARPRSCGDSVALNFSLLETRVWVGQATQGLAEEAREGALVGLGRALRRLDEVDRLASLDIQAREARGAVFDEVEVRLAYRVGLRQDLGLPGQPVDMMYFQSAELSRTQIRQVGAQVLEGETPQALSLSLAEWPFWLDYLRDTQSLRFEEVDAPFHERLEALSDRQMEISDGDYLRQVDAIAAEREVARQAAISLLTQAAVERHGSMMH